MCLLLYMTVDMKSQELQRIKKAWEAEQQLLVQREKDLSVLKSECEAVRSSEQILRQERSKMLAELALLRDRVRWITLSTSQHLLICREIGEEINIF